MVFRMNRVCPQICDNVQPSQPYDLKYVSIYKNNQADTAWDSKGGQYFCT